MSAPNIIVTSGIVLNRINFGEADRILTVITPDQGKLSLIAKGVRKEKSKLAGGIELFSVSNISFIPPKKEIGTLVSSRLVTHYGEIVKELPRTNTAYSLLTTINSITEAEPGSEYYHLLVQSLSALNDKTSDPILIEAWFYARMIKIQGHQPNLVTDDNGYSLAQESNYNFDFDAMCFARKSTGQYTSKHIKLLRLLFDESLERIGAITDLNDVLLPVEKLLQQIISTDS